MIFDLQRKNRLVLTGRNMRKRPNGRRVPRLWRDIQGLGAHLLMSRGALAGACLVTLTLLAGPLPAQATGPSSYELGLEAVENYRYGEALMHFQRAAEQGDRSARRNLGLMMLYGDALYGKEVLRNKEQAKRWLRAAAGDGCEVSAFMLKLLAQHGA